MPSVPITLSFNVTPLPDNAIWFANSAAWSNYWNNSAITTNIPVATTIGYGVVTQGTSSGYVDPGYTGDTVLDMVYNGVNYLLITQAGYDSFKAQFDALNANFKNLKAALIISGVITA